LSKIERNVAPWSFNRALSSNLLGHNNEVPLLARRIARIADGDVVTSEGSSGLSAGERMFQLTPAGTLRNPTAPPSSPGSQEKFCSHPGFTSATSHHQLHRAQRKVNFKPRAVVVGFAFLQFRAGRPESPSSRDFFDAALDATGKMFSAKFARSLHRSNPPQSLSGRQRTSW
jgi:hypothetical protein